MSHRITDWDPEDVVAWVAGNKFIARRNLIWSVAAEHIGFSVWSLWSVMVLFMPESVYGFSASDKFLLGRSHCMPRRSRSSVRCSGRCRRCTAASWPTALAAAG
jgi:hypothetical protein